MVSRIESLLIINIISAITAFPDESHLGTNMADHLKTAASNLSSSSSLKHFVQRSPSYLPTNESPKSQQPGMESRRGATIPRIKKPDIAKRQSENVTPIPSRRAERGEVGQVPPHQQVAADSHFQRKVKEILSNPSTSTRNRYTANRTTVKVSKCRPRA